jgi:hypothetical protein
MSQENVEIAPAPKCTNCGSTEDVRQVTLFDGEQAWQTLWCEVCRHRAERESRAGEG